MKLFEHEAKTILSRYGITVPRGALARSPEEAAEIAVQLGVPVFLKAQVTVSGRGKSGGILPADSPREALQIASRILGLQIKGIKANSLLVEEKLDIRKQLYASVAIDRQAKAFVALVSSSGGVDIEEVAAAAPQKILRMRIDPEAGLTADMALELTSRLDLGPDERSRLASLLSSLYRAALDCDAEMVELNPLVITGEDGLVAADARLIIDDNAIFRHPEFMERSLLREEDTPREAEARRLKFSYVDLDGDIGIIGNGAGLVMATLDMVNLFGGKPANFLDIGGGAQVEVIRNGLLLVMGKPEVRVVLVNILGGITRCDLVATGVVEGLQAAPVKKPVVVRMMGTNEEVGREILAQHGISFYPDMEKAAEAAVRSRR